MIKILISWTAQQIIHFFEFICINTKVGTFSWCMKIKGECSTTTTSFLICYQTFLFFSKFLCPHWQFTHFMLIKSDFYFFYCNMTCYLPNIVKYLQTVLFNNLKLICKITKISTVKVLFIVIDFFVCWLATKRITFSSNRTSFIQRTKHRLLCDATLNSVLCNLILISLRCSFNCFWQKRNQLCVVHALKGAPFFCTVHQLFWFKLTTH